MKRSNGCMACRAKKKRCDEGQPTCQRCGRAGIDCSYNQLIWQTPLYPKKPVEEDADQICSAAIQHSVPRMPPRLDMEHIFWQLFSPKVCDGVVIMSDSIARSTAMIVSTEGSVVVQRAMRACAYLCVGVVQEDYAISRLGMQHYGAALLSINAALSNAGEIDTDQVLVACWIMSLCEMFRPNLDQTASKVQDRQRHVSGLQRLLRLRQARNGSSGAADWLTREVNILVTRAGVAFRNRCGEALLLPSAGHEPLLTEQLAHMDILAGLLQRYDFLNRAPAFPDLTKAPILAYVLQLFEDSITFGAELVSWECRLQQRWRIDDKELSGSSAEQYDLLLAIGNFSATCAILFSQSRLTYERFRMLEPSFSVDLPAYMDAGPYGVQLVDCIEKLLSPAAGLWGVEKASFLVTTAIAFYSVTDGLKSAAFRKLDHLLTSSPQGRLLDLWSRCMAASTQSREHITSVRTWGEQQHSSVNWYGFG